MIKRGLDIKLNVRPVFIALIHEAYYEGPCRFGKADSLQPGFDTQFNHQLFEQFVKNVKENMPDEVLVLDPIYIERTDSFVTKEELYSTLAKGMDETDLYIFHLGIGRGDISIEFAQRFHKPIAIEPTRCCELSTSNAALRSRGLEVYAGRTWRELAITLRALRLRKILSQTNILLTTRFNSQSSYSATDTFINLDQVTAKLGVKFRYINFHELMDEMNTATPEGNYTTPGRMMPNITEEELVEAGKIADEMMAKAQEVKIERKFLINSLIAYLVVKKNLDLHDCNAFTIPCPDSCATRRMNEQKMTFCLTHSLLNEEGIPSACEYDINAAVSIMLLEAISGNAAYMGNANVLPYENDELQIADGLRGMKFPNIKDKTNLYHVFHSTVNRKFHGIDAEASPFALRHFAFEQEFGAVFRYDFNRDIGQVITVVRFSPDLTKMLVGKGTIVCGGGYDTDNCNGFVIYRVRDQKKFFDAQMEVGNHLPLVYGDYVEELELMGDILGLEVLKV